MGQDPTIVTQVWELFNKRTCPQKGAVGRSLFFILQNSNPKPTVIRICMTHHIVAKIGKELTISTNFILWNSVPLLDAAGYTHNTVNLKIQLVELL